MLTFSTGTVTRALPTAAGLEIKLVTADGALTLEVPSERPELVRAARQARMTGDGTTVRHSSGAVVAFGAPDQDLAA